MRQKGFAPIIILLVFALLGAFGYIAYLKGYINLSPKIVVTPAPYPIESKPTPTIDPLPNWKTYTSDILGIEFKLPPKLVLLESSGKETPGETGTQYCLYFSGSITYSFVKNVFAGGGACGGYLFTIGSESKNYSAGREGGFGDLTGYVYQDGKYYPRFINTLSTTPIPADLIEEKTNVYGVKYLKITGKNAPQDRGGELFDMPIPGTPGKLYLGALVNIENPKYSGFNIQLEIKSAEDTVIFDKILSTFKFTQ